MKSEYKETLLTYFTKDKKITIDEISIGDMVIIEVNSPLNYGIRTWSYFGQIAKITKCYFEIIEYSSSPELGYWYTSSIHKCKNNPSKYTKKWAKKSLISLYKVACFEKTEILKTYSNKN